MIAVIGDIMLDEYIYGSSTRQSPECANAPVVVINPPIRTLGGAGNTALNIHHLGGEVKLYCAVNYESNLFNKLKTSDIPYFCTNNTAPDVVKTRIYSNGKYVARLDIDSAIKHYEARLVASMIDESPEIILISDYGKGTIKKPQEIIAKAKEIGAIVLVDSKSNLSDFKGATVIKPNLKEFYEWIGIDLPRDMCEAVNKLHRGLLKDSIEQLQIDNLIITLGELGCIHASANSINMYPALPIQAIDVTGAGDTFIAGLAVALSEGKDIKRSIQFANRAASIAVTKKGTQHVERNEI
jgi:D-beta-D-heptose 7-phosphate kinase/D-beta-D-heptose 1-phosphate adenosyltransferase